MSLSYDYITAYPTLLEADPDYLQYELNPDLIHRELWWPHANSVGWLRADNLFPGALICVCSHWMDVLRQVSVFWTRLIIFVDDDPTPLSTLQLHLSLSRTHPLEINILRHSFSCDDPLERSRVTAVMRTLRPHVSRCKVLRMALRHHTSLPHPCIDIHGLGDQLEVLQLQAGDEDEDERVENWYEPDQMLGPFSTAKLEILNTGSNIFHDVFVVPKQQLVLLTELTINGGGETQYRDLSVRMVVCFVNELPKLKKLSLTSPPVY